MKLKFMLVPLAVLGFAVGSYADCSKNEIMKLIDKGFSKNEIKGICNKSESKKEELSWITTNSKICEANGGKMDYDGRCLAKWSQAKDICSASSARLPSIYELRKVIVDCGGVVDDFDNKANSSYQSCYKRKGFTSDFYWSSTTRGASDSSSMWLVFFSLGTDTSGGKGFKFDVRCVRGGQ